MAFSFNDHSYDYSQKSGHRQTIWWRRVQLKVVDARVAKKEEQKEKPVEE
jgi:hypothetical protein